MGIKEHPRELGTVDWIYSEGGEPFLYSLSLLEGIRLARDMGFKVRRSWRQIARCPHEDLESPSRVHVDPYGNVHLCRGLLMGNIWERPLSALVLPG